ncbi:MAG: choice-of-anchor B domain-containing protein [Saprospiraceae bacterium]|jgi:choice-of-anchor B domain-containing protein
MKKTLLFLFLLSSTLGYTQVSLNMSLLGNYDNDMLPTHSYGTFNDVWGYVDANNREYAIMGSAAFIHFFDVTDPANLVEIAAIAGGDTTVWRDFKVYGDRIYAVSDGAQEGLIIFDASSLPAAPTITYQSTAFFGSCHNIQIDEVNGRLYAVGTNTQNKGLIVFDIATNPDQPQLLGNVNLESGMIGGYIHDLYVKDNIAYCSHGNTSSFVIWDFTDAAAPEYIASFVSNGYNHSNWVSEDGNTVIFAEEVPTGLPLGLLDISDMANDNLSLYQYFKFPLLAPDHEGSTPHNPFILGDLAFTSYYEDGVQVFDISDPNNPHTVAYYDTYPNNTEYNGYKGCWGVYPYLPSGNILASDFNSGLFVLRLDGDVSTDDLGEVKSFRIFPNPVYEELTVEMETVSAQEVNFQITSMTGQLLKTVYKEINGLDKVSIDLSDLPAGIYILNANLEDDQIAEKIVKY